MADLGSSTQYGLVSSTVPGTPGPDVENSGVSTTAANLVLLAHDAALDFNAQRRTATELGRCSVEVAAMLEVCKIQLLDYIANKNS